MITFKFDYLVKPTTKYKLRYGLKIKARPYPFNYPVGIDNGGIYRLKYDRRDEVYIENNEKTYVLWPRDMNINNEPNPFIKKMYEIKGNKEFDLTKPIYKEIIEENTNNELKIIFHEFHKESLFGLNKNITKNLELENEITLDKTIEKILDIYQDFLLRKTIFKGLIIEKSQHILKKLLKKEINIENPIIAVNKAIDELIIDSDGNVLDKVINGIEKEIERQFFKENKFGLEKDIFSVKLVNTFVELFYVVINEQLELNLFKDLDIFKELKLTNDFIRNIDVEKIDEILSKEEKGEILIKSAILLSKLESEINIHKEEGSYFRVLNEIFEHEESLNNMLYLFAIYDMIGEIDFIQAESKGRDIEQFKTKILDENFEKDLKIENAFKTLVNNTKHKLYKDIKGKLLKDETKHEADIEECFKQIEKICEISINIEKRMERLDKEYVVDLYEEKDVYQLIKKLVVHDLITEEESQTLEKSLVGKILLEQSMTINKIAKMREIEIDKSIPMVIGYKEIMINEDINAAKEVIEIDIDKEKEFWKMLNEIELQDDEEKIKFNKRFWFLRATDPFDWKVLPYSDYPYKKKPIIFGKELIPDNWQLDMLWVSRLYEGVYEHPIPFGEDLGSEEMALSIEIMIDIINIMILIWSRMYYNFSGYTGSQAVIRFTKILYDWLMLETSIEEMEKKGSKEHYFRCYRWIRWEAEKVAIKTRNDMKLNGNMYISEWIFELIYYMENHHFDTMPIFNVIEKMDEFRALLPDDDPQGDINFVLDKVKGMRHKIIECKANKSNE